MILSSGLATRSLRVGRATVPVLLLLRLEADALLVALRVVDGDRRRLEVRRREFRLEVDRRFFRRRRGDGLWRRLAGALAIVLSE